MVLQFNQRHVYLSLVKKGNIAKYLPYISHIALYSLWYYSELFYDVKVSSKAIIYE